MSSMKMEDRKSKTEVKTRMSLSKEAFNKNEFSGSMDLEMTQRLVKCYVVECPIARG